MQTKTVDIHEAQTHLVELLSLVTAGTEIILTEGSTPLARIVPWQEPPHASPDYTLAPSGPARTLTTHYPKNSDRHAMKVLLDTHAFIWWDSARRSSHRKPERMSGSDESTAPQRGQCLGDAN